MTGTYSVSGPTEVVNGNFSTTFGLASPNNSVLDVSDFPNSIATGVGYGLMGGPRLFSPPIADVNVDGIDVHIELSSARAGVGILDPSSRLLAVPEPSTGFCLIMSLTALGCFRRRDHQQQSQNPPAPKTVS